MGVGVGGGPLGQALSEAGGCSLPSRYPSVASLI